MSLYAISGVCNTCEIGYEDFEPSSMISGKKKTVRKAKRTARKIKRKSKRTGINCKGSKLKKIALAVPRNAFLSLVRLNVKKFAVKLYNAMKDPIKKQKLLEKWCKMGGDASALTSAVNKAFSKYARKRKISGIGFAVESAVATATPIIVALLEFLKKGANEQPVEDGAQIEETPEDTETETVEGIGAMNPYLLAGAVGVGVYFLTKKKYI
jgi:hypothetical protein